MIAAAWHVEAMLPEVAALRPGEPMPSPCNNVCRIDPQSGFCEGCLRTIEEVVAWGSLDEGGKRQVWRQLEERARALTPTLSQRERESSRAPQSPAPSPSP